MNASQQNIVNPSSTQVYGSVDQITIQECSSPHTLHDLIEITPESSHKKTSKSKQWFQAVPLISLILLFILFTRPEKEDFEQGRDVSGGDTVQSPSVAAPLISQFSDLENRVCYEFDLSGPSPGLHMTVFSMGKVCEFTSKEQITLSSNEYPNHDQRFNEHSSPVEGSLIQWPSVENDDFYIDQPSFQTSLTPQMRSAQMDYLNGASPCLVIQPLITSLWIDEQEKSINCDGTPFHTETRIKFYLNTTLTNEADLKHISPAIGGDAFVFPTMRGAWIVTMSEPTDWQCYHDDKTTAISAFHSTTTQTTIEVVYLPSDH